MQVLLRVEEDNIYIFDLKKQKDNDKLSFFCYNTDRIVDNSSRWYV